MEQKRMESANSKLKFHRELSGKRSFPRISFFTVRKDNQNNDPCDGRADFLDSKTLFI